MRWLLGRELTVIIRCGGFWAAMAGQLALLGAFVVIWGSGFPIQGAGAPIEQFVAAHVALSSVILPWIALRCSVPGGREGVAAVALATAIRPSATVIARCAALVIGLGLVTATSLPLTLVMQQVSARRLPEVLPMLVPLAGICVLAAVSATMASLVFRSRLLAWMVATLGTVLIVAVSPPASMPVVSTLVALCGAILASRWVNTDDVYLPEAPRR